MEKALCEASLLDFMRVFWPEVEGVPFQNCWHTEAICEHLEALTRLQIRKLCINGPPRHGKSRPASIFWQPWEWIHKPENNWLTCAIGLELAIEFNYFSRAIIKSEKYQRYWGKQYAIVENNDLKKQFMNNLGAKRLAVGMDSRFIGFGGDRKILDDPHMPDDTPLAMEKVWEWFRKTWRTRTNNPKTAAELLNMQRLSVYDLTEHIKVHEKALWEFLILPSKFDPAKRYWTLDGMWTDPRTELGELLFPSMFGEREESELRASLDDKADAQMDQDPSNVSDVLYKPETLKNFYTELVYNRETDIVCSSIDCGVKSKDTSDYSACLVGIKKGNRFFHIDCFAEKKEFGDLLKLYKDLLSKWTNKGLRFYKHLVEDAALGPALANIAEKKFSRVELIKAIKNKLVRLKSVVPVYEANRVWYPAPNAVIIIDGIRHEAGTEGLAEWIKQTREVPFGKNDDGPDATAQWIAETEDVTYDDAEYEDDDYEGGEDYFFRIH